MNQLLELLATIEHDQWAHWTRYMLDNMTPENEEKWRRQTEISYSSLSDVEKESDRRWARKVLDTLCIVQAMCEAEREQCANIADSVGGEGEDPATVCANSIAWHIRNRRYQIGGIDRP